MESGAFAKQEGLVLIREKPKVNKVPKYLLSYLLLLLSVALVRLSSQVNNNKIRRLIYEI